jgi:hypothetical protein
MTKTKSHSDRTRTLRVQLVDGDPEGLRHVDSLSSTVRVTAAPLPVLRLFTSDADNRVGFMAYVCEGPLSYIGHGCAERRMGQKYGAADRDRVYQAFSVYSLGPDFGKDVAEKLEDRLTEIARGRRVALANDPKVGGLGKADRSPAIEELLHDVRLKLWVAGCRLLGHPHTADKPGAAIFDGVEVVTSEDFEKMEKTQPVRLVYPGMQASACTVGSKFVVAPGSNFSLVTKKGLSRHNTDRRDFVQGAGILEGIPGNDKRALLRAALAFESDSIAAKVVIGKHVNGKVWVSEPQSVGGAGHD